MKKLFTVLFVAAALFTFTVSSATAASFFVANNSTSWVLNGIAANASDSGTTSTTSVGKMTGTLTLNTYTTSNLHGMFLATADTVTSQASGGAAAVTHDLSSATFNATYTTDTVTNQLYTPQTTKASYYIANFNSTQTPNTMTEYMVIDGSTYNMFGVGGNRTAVDTTNSSSGTNMITMAQKETATTALVNGTAWKFFRLCLQGPNATTQIGAVDTSNVLRYTDLYDGNDNSTNTKATLTWAVNADGTVNATTSGGTYLNSAVLDKTKKTIFNVYNASNYMECLAVFVQGSTFTTDALKNKQYYTVGYGLNGTTNPNSIAKYGFVRLDTLAANSTESSSTWFYTAGTTETTVKDTLSGTIAVADKSFGASATDTVTAVTNLTMADGSTFYGVKRSDGKLFVGINVNTGKLSKGGLMFIIPEAGQPTGAVAQTENQVEAALGIDYNPTTRSTYGLPGTNATAPFVGVTAAAAVSSTYTTSIDYNSDSRTAVNAAVSMADADLITNFNAPSGFAKKTNFAPTMFTLNSGTTQNAYIIAPWTIQAKADLGNLAGETISNIALYKFMNVGGSGNQTVAMTQASGTNATSATKGDGYYWWSLDNANATILTTGTFDVSAYDNNKKYILWTVLKDDGNYDSNRAGGTIIDPPVGSAASSALSSGTTGCVFNPAASFGLEWLLLLVAPVVAVVRNRFRK